MKMELKILMKTGVQKYSLGQDKTSLDSVILLVNDLFQGSSPASADTLQPSLDHLQDSQPPPAPGDGDLPIAAGPAWRAVAGAEFGAGAEATTVEGQPRVSRPS